MQVRSDDQLRRLVEAMREAGETAPGFGAIEIHKVFIR